MNVCSCGKKLKTIQGLIGHQQRTGHPVLASAAQRCPALESSAGSALNQRSPALESTAGQRSNPALPSGELSALSERVEDIAAGLDYMMGMVDALVPGEAHHCHGKDLDCLECQVDLQDAYKQGAEDVTARYEALASVKRREAVQVLEPVPDIETMIHQALKRSRPS